MDTTTTARPLLAPLAPALPAFRARRILTGLPYVLLLPLSALAKEPEQKQQHSDFYIMY